MAWYLSYLDIFLATATISLTFTFLFFKAKKDPRYPPGPRALPILGNLLQLDTTYPYRTFSKWAKEYGPVFSIKMGSEDAIIINDHKLAKELLSEAAAGGRIANPVLDMLSGGSYGVIANEGPDWKAQRQFTLRKLKDFGFAKTSLEGMILEEVHSLLNYLKKTEGSPLELTRVFNGAVVNALWNIISGERNEWDTDEQPEILKTSGDLLRAANLTTNSGLFFAPSLRYIAPGFFGWTAWVNSTRNFQQMVSVAISKHTSSIFSSSPRDFIDHYLNEIHETKDTKSSFFKENGDKNLLATVADLFMAGSETTANTLVWSFLYLSHYQTIQKKVQQVVDTVIGSSRLPSVSDRPSLPYAEAVIMEVLRLSSIAPVGIPHRMLQDFVFKGYFLPKGVGIMLNQQGIHHDVDVWGSDANAFRPERFLNEDNTAVIRHEALLPFGVGKRQCIGEALARDTLFLFLSSILQKFNVELDSNCAKADFEPQPGLFSFPKPFKVVLSVRNLT